MPRFVLDKGAPLARAIAVPPFTPPFSPLPGAHTHLLLWKAGTPAWCRLLGAASATLAPLRSCEATRGAPCSQVRSPRGGAATLLCSCPVCALFVSHLVPIREREGLCQRCNSKGWSPYVKASFPSYLIAPYTLWTTAKLQDEHHALIFRFHTYYASISLSEVRT